MPRTAARRRFPMCYRNVALLAAALGILCCSAARAQIAPGPLSQAHAHLEGITKCTSCHDIFGGRLKCLECHVEIKRRVEAGTGYHSHAYKKSADAVDCARCHSEHRSERSTLIPLDRRNFDHGALTGFALEGRHREQQCENCHAAAKIPAAARSEIKIKDLNRSFLGLRRECTSCHKEPHGNQLGADCLRCHTPEAWKPVSRFSHSRTTFPLTGMHQQVPCEKCHARAAGAPAGKALFGNASAQVSFGQRLLFFRGLASNGCRSCHPDQHNGIFQDLKGGGKCEQCHDTGGFKDDRTAAAFDHSLARFPLVGKHATLPCQRCHKENNFTRRIAHELCRNCHQDPHKGQFALRAAGQDCSMCHRPTSFKPALFDRAKHAGGVFPLEGKHSTLACVRCHQPVDNERGSSPVTPLCSSCHAEPHGGQFASEPYNNNCDLCHTEKGFETTTFSIERHARTRFPLAGSHADVACYKCHKPLPADPEAALEKEESSFPESPLPSAEKNTGLPDARRQYHFTSRACNVCHADPHGFDPGTDLPCEACHAPQEWKTLLPFDHTRPPVKLEGAHQNLVPTSVCVKCHAVSGKAGVPVFSGISARCSGCHTEKEPHGGQFGEKGSEQKDCSSCHAPKTWNDVTFDHSKTRFALNGVHRDLSCSKCHKEQKAADGRIVRLYRDTPADCLKCH